MRGTFLAVAAALAATIAAPAQAAVAILSGPDVITGVKGVVVDDLTYDVSFVEGGVDATFAGNSAGVDSAIAQLLAALNSTTAAFVLAQGCCTTSNFFVQDTATPHEGRLIGSDGTPGGWVEADPRSSYGTFAVFSRTDLPEPATWALMIGGFSLVGGALRRQRIAKGALEALTSPLSPQPGRKA